MANEFLKPTVINRTALGLLQREIVLPSQIWVNGAGDFAGAADDTISLRVPARLTGRSRTLRAGTPIVTDDVTETKVDVTLTDDAYNSVAITDEELTLDIASFGDQVLNPQIRAVAEKLEQLTADVVQAADYEVSLELDAESPWDTIIDARKALNDARVPRANRVLAIGSAIESVILKDPELKRVDASGSDSALRDAVIGRLGGFLVVGVDAFDENFAVAMHQTAFAMALRAPVVPTGAVAGATAAYQGLALRWLRDYDYENTSDRSLVNSYVGVTAVTDRPADDPVEGAPALVRAVEITYSAS